MHTKFGPTVTKLCSGQGNPDDDATANKSNPYMSPFQATQSVIFQTITRNVSTGHRCLHFSTFVTKFSNWQTRANLNAHPLKIQNRHKNCKEFAALWNTKYEAMTFIYIGKVVKNVAIKLFHLFVTQGCPCWKGMICCHYLKLTFYRLYFPQDTIHCLLIISQPYTLPHE